MEQAFNTLGLSLDASKNEIEKAFKKLRSEGHQDKGGKGIDQAALKEAYIVALEAVNSSSKALIVRSSHSLQRSINSQKAQSDFYEKIRNLKDNVSKKGSLPRKIASIFGVLFALLGVFGRSALPWMKNENSILYDNISTIFFILAAITGLVATVSAFNVKWFDEKLDDLGKRLSEARECARLSAKVLNYKDLCGFTRNEFTRMLSDSGIIEELFSRDSIASEELSSLLIAKMEEHEMIEKVPYSLITQNSDDSFVVREIFKPSVFDIKNT